MNWFDVDKAGLAKLLERKGKAFALYELIQNAWDTNAGVVNVRFEELAGPYTRVSVADDDPTGFVRLDHAFTLFAESDKKNDPSKRGRFNLGEKLVLALCRWASIQSTTGTVIFEEKGRRVNKTARRPEGSSFVGEMRMTRAELADVRTALARLIPPPACLTIIDGRPLQSRSPLRTFEVALATETADEEGTLRRTERITEVSLHELLFDEVPQLYEMGIPVCELAGGEPWHVNVHQKVPLNFDRDNVTPGYLRRLRAATLNAAHDSIPEGAQPWLADALADSRVSRDGANAALTARFGEKRVIADPTDPEGTKLAVSQGYTVIHGGSLSSDEWARVKEHGVALPAGQVTPSPKPYSPGGDPLNIVPEAEWTPEQRAVCLFAERLAIHLFDGGLNRVRIVREISVGWSATYGDRVLTLNVGRLGHRWFDPANTHEIVRLLIHEFGHHYSMDHLSAEYHDALCTLGSKLAHLAAKSPRLLVISATGKRAARELPVTFRLAGVEHTLPLIEAKQLVADLIARVTEIDDPNEPQLWAPKG